MHRIDTATAAAAMPAIGAPGPQPNGYWTIGNPGTGTPATAGDADWFNELTEEILSVLTSVGIAPVKGVLNQLLAAIRLLIGSGGGAAMTRIFVGASPLNVGLTDKDIAVTMAAPAALAIALPAGAPTGFEISIKDLGTNFFAHHATVTPPTGTVEGGANFVLDVQSGKWTFKKYGVDGGGNDIWGIKA